MASQLLMKGPKCQQLPHTVSFYQAPRAQSSGLTCFTPQEWQTGHIDPPGFKEGVLYHQHSCSLRRHEHDFTEGIATI